MSRTLSPDERLFIERMPKVELHVHLEGSVYPSTLMKLAEKHGRNLPFSDLDGAREWFQFRDFSHFVEIYIEICSNLRDEEDYSLITWEMARRAHQENNRYLEVTYAPASILNPRIPGTPDVAVEGIREGARRAAEEFGVEMNFILDPVRGRQPEEVMELARWFLKNIGDRLIGFGLGGIEVGNPASLYRDAFELARSAGGRTPIHAGETDGPESVRDALATGAERVGHGVTSIRDPELVRELADSAVVLEVSPTSNVCLGVVPEFSAHPFPDLYEAGVQVTLNSDDPPMFDTTLTNEYIRLAEEFDFTLSQIVDLVFRAVDAAFVDSAEKRRLREQYAGEMQALAQELEIRDLRVSGVDTA
ncbi:MAG: adenosine deaminase [Chloroflexota bacterium]